MLVNRGKRKMYGVESICRMTDLFFDEGQTGGGGAPLSMPGVDKKCVKVI